MVQTLEAIKGGGGSIKVGATGTISSLMTRELNSLKYSKNKTQAGSVSVSCGVSAPKRSQPRKSSNEASSSGSGNNVNKTEIFRKTKTFPKKTHQIPMLRSNNVSLDRTPSREKSESKGPRIVEIVDIKCRNQDISWSSPIRSRLRKLGFSKLSESIA